MRDDAIGTVVLSTVLKRTAECRTEPHMVSHHASSLFQATCVLPPRIDAGLVDFNNVFNRGLQSG